MGMGLHIEIHTYTMLKDCEKYRFKCPECYMYYMKKVKKCDFCGNRKVYRISKIEMDQRKKDRITFKHCIDELVCDS